MSRLAWRPGDHPGPARFGLTDSQWRRVLEMHASYQKRGPLDRSTYEPTPRMEFCRWLVRRGIVNEGRRYD